MACLEDPAPLLDCKLKCLCSANRQIICPCSPMNRRYYHTPSEGWTFLWRCFARLKTLSLYFPSASPSLVCLLTLVPRCLFLSDLLNNLASRPQQDGYFEALACRLLGLPAPQLKSLPCLNTSSLGFIGLPFSEQSELGLRGAWQPTHP